MLPDRKEKADMKYIKGVTFAPFVSKGRIGTEASNRSLKIMKEQTGADFVILAPGAIQKTCISEEIDFSSDATMTDEELVTTIRYAKSIGLRVALKPTVNCADHVWRGHVHFFDIDVPCEPKWGRWFEYYTKFQLHYAKIAEEEGCEMFIAGCEMVMTEIREKEWRKLISDIRQVFHGLISYNTDKYQEDHVRWWDAVDVISSSGYYPIHDWENQLDRIETVVKKYDKPFFFAEAGCMSRNGSNQIPNDWTIQGELDLEGQAEFYRSMFAACAKRDWVQGFGLWSWSEHLKETEEALKDTGYELYEKPAVETVKTFYEKNTIR